MEVKSILRPALLDNVVYISLIMTVVTIIFFFASDQCVVIDIKCSKYIKTFSLYFLFKCLLIEHIHQYI